MDDNKLLEIYADQLSEICAIRGRGIRAIRDSCKCVGEQARALEALASTIPELRPLAEKMRDVVYNVCTESTSIDEACKLLKKEK